MCKFVKYLVLCVATMATITWQFLLDPKEIAIVSILDFSNDIIVRDLLTMVRSLRLFGGNLNEATLIIGVIASNKIERNRVGHYSKDQFDNIRDLVQLGAQLEFLNGALQTNHSRTMNKLQIFNVIDPIKFSHILWLDADILILNDPTPHIFRHSYPGSVDCVPELYNYMRRYPKINGTNFVWNPQLSSVTLLGSTEQAPPGTCNTGVMLLDSVVLPRIVNCIKDLESNRLVVPEEYLTDRFLDSLYFVLSVNMESIDINYLPYSFNYMAFFIGEYESLNLGINDIYFAHFLWDPYFYCFIPQQNNQCECISSNQYQQDSNILYRTINAKIVQNVTACRFLAGVYPSDFSKQWKNLTRNRKIDDTVKKHYLQRNVHPHTSLGAKMVFDTCNQLVDDIGFSCSPLWPPAFYDKKMVASNQILSLSFVFTCSNNQAENSIVTRDIMSIKGRIRLSLNSKNLVVNSTEEIMFTRSPSHSHDEAPVQLTYFQSAPIDILIRSNQVAVNNELSKIFSMAETLSVDLQYSVLVQHPQFGDICVNRAQRVQEEVGNLSLNLVSSTVSLYEEAIGNAPKRAVYSSNPLKSPRSLSLPSQLLLPEYIKSTLMVNKQMRSILFCCESSKGIKTTQRLLRLLSNSGVVMISLVVVTLPTDLLLKELASSSSGVLVSQTILDSLFKSFCQTNSCHILSLLPDLIQADTVNTVQPTTLEDLVIYLQAFAQKSIHLIYVDLFTSYGFGINPAHMSRDALFQSFVDFSVICRTLLVGNTNSLILGGFHYSSADDVALFDEKGNVEHLSMGGNHQDKTGFPPAEFVSFMWQHQFVLQMSLFLQSPPLYTYAESLKTYCAIDYLEEEKRVSWWKECSPAWYFVY